MSRDVFGMLLGALVIGMALGAMAVTAGILIGGWR